MKINGKIYKSIYSSVYKVADMQGVDPVPAPRPPAPPRPRPRPRPNPTYILKKTGYVQTSFEDFAVDPNSNVRRYSQEYTISTILEMSAFMGGKRVNGSVPVTHFTKGGEELFFEEVGDVDSIVVWSVCVTTVNNVMNTYGIETRIRAQNTGLQIRAGRMKYVAGNHPLTDFDNTGTVGRLAKAETQNIIGLKNITLTLQLPQEA